MEKCSECGKTITKNMSPLKSNDLIFCNDVCFHKYCQKHPKRFKTDIQGLRDRGHKHPFYM